MKSRRALLGCFAGVVGTITLLAACGRPQEGASTKSIIGAMSLEPLTSKDKTPLIQSMGSVQVVLSDPNAGNEVFALPYCSGFRIAADRVLTAAHCHRENLIFNPGHVASDGAVGGFQVTPFGPEIRLTFTGEISSESKRFVRQDLTMKLLWIDKSLDAAIYKLPDEVKGPFIDLSKAVLPGGKARLLGYPNGVPIAQSGTCEAFIDTYGDLRHNCAALTGSSGGLLISENGLPMALHQQGVGVNLADFYQKNGRFETSTDFAQRAGCDEKDQPCAIKHGWNRATPLAKISKAIEGL